MILTERCAVGVLLMSQMARNLVCKARDTRLGTFISIRVFKMVATF